MRSVWKYPLLGFNEEGHLTSIVELPAGAKVLNVAEQKGVPHMWVLLDNNPEAPKEPRHFVVRGTGHNVEEDLVYVGTWQSPPFVWHLFEKTK